MRCFRWLLALLVAAHAGTAGAGPDLTTVAQRSDYRATSSYDETVDWLRRFDAAAPWARVLPFGRSAAGREIPLVVVSRDGAFGAERARATGKPVVMIQNGIHGGEIDGKDACLELLREMLAGRHERVLDGLILLVVPIYNVDGHERVSPYNRPNQNGPVEGMGFRTSVDGHDLNRDHLKIETPEARALVHLIDTWRPHLHVDDHVTDGSDHAWTVTYSWAEAPQIAPSVDAWLAATMPRVVERTRAAGVTAGPYVDLLDRGDPAQGFDSRVVEPHYATGYWPLRNRASILVEMHAPKPYRERVAGNREFLAALLDEVAARPRGLLDAVAAADARTTALGAPDAEPSPLVLTWRPGEPDTIEWPVHDWRVETSPVMGVPVVRYDPDRVRPQTVPWIHRSAPDTTVPRPRGYLVPPGWPAIDRRLALHGLTVRTLSEPVELEVESIRVADARLLDPAGPTYQGLARLEADVTRTVEIRPFPAGTRWIPADQPLFEVAAQLLEPEASSSLFRWGLLSTVIERKEYIAPRNLDVVAAGMLAESPALAAEWAAALQDEAFAADPGARYAWWYERTPYHDDTIGLLPVFRRLGPPPEGRTEAWSPPHSDWYLTSPGVQ